MPILTRNIVRRSKVVLLTLALGAVPACRDHFAHPLRGGTLAEVATPSLIVGVWEGKHFLSIANEARDGACLELGGLKVVIDGVTQTDVYIGGRSSGRTKGNIGPIDRTDSCDAARVQIVLPSDPARAKDVIEVSDGSRTLRAEFPNLLAESVWAEAPPSTLVAGGVFRVRVSPAPPVGVGSNDPGNYLVASLTEAGGTDAQLKLVTRVLGAGQLEIAVPAGAKPGAYTLYLVSAQGSVPALACSAPTCSAASELVLTASVVVRAP